MMLRLAVLAAVHPLIAAAPLCTVARSNGDDPDGSTGQQAVSATYSATSESFNGKPVWKGQHMKLCWAPDQGVQGDGTYGRCVVADGRCLPGRCWRVGSRVGFVDETTSDTLATSHKNQVNSNQLKTHIL